MLIKSECQPLDKTRHKPAWSLFEQRELCKMAREICNVACPLNSHTTLLPSLRTTCPGRQMDGRTGGERCGEPTEAQLFCSLSGWHQPADTQCKQGSVMAQPRSPSLTSWCFHQISLTITVLEARHTYVRTCWNHGPCNYGEQSLSEQTHYMNNYQWKRPKNAQGWL